MDILYNSNLLSKTGPMLVNISGLSRVWMPSHGRLLGDIFRRKKRGTFDKKTMSEKKIISVEKKRDRKSRAKNRNKPELGFCLSPKKTMEQLFTLCLSLASWFSKNLENFSVIEDLFEENHIGFSNLSFHISLQMALRNSSVPIKSERRNWIV